MTAPVTYSPAFVADPARVFEVLWADLAWERRGLTPRREYYCNDVDVPYKYGTGAGEREYTPSDWHPEILIIKKMVEARIGSAMEVCFLNGYENSRDHLGWHADDSPEMDDARPIAIITLGAEREIWFCPNEDKTLVTKIILGDGSLCLMEAGMQDTWRHRIPKAGFECGTRISLTFRGYVPVG